MSPARHPPRTDRKLRTPLAALLALATLGAAFPACAGVFSVAAGPAAGPPGGVGSPDVLLQFAGDGETNAAQVDFRVDPNLFQLTATSLGSLSCAVVAPGQVRMLVMNFDGSPLAAADTPYCLVKIAIAADAPLGAYAIDSVPGSTMCANGTESVSPCTALDAPGSITVELEDTMFFDDFE